MTHKTAIRFLRHIFMLGFVFVSGDPVSLAEFTQNAPTPKLHSSIYPPNLRKGLRLFKIKCNACHGLDLSLKTNMAPDRWAKEVKRMQAMPSARFNDKQAQAILNFLNYDEAHRKPSITAPAAASVPDSVSAGRTLYYAQSCDACHSIGGKGGQAGPPMDDVGATRSREQLIRRLQDRRAGAAMPPLPSDTTDQQINQIVDFLLTLKGK